jgi:hypothetical protein
LQEEVAVSGNRCTQILKGGRAPIQWGYNPRVTAFLQFGMHVLTVLFFIGLAGASVVVVISFVEDLKELLGD